LRNTRVKRCISLTRGAISGIAAILLESTVTGLFS
jgi:hypothetical protein